MFSKITEQIRKECGIENLTALHINSLVVCVQLAFKTKDCILLFYKSEEGSFLVLMPTNEPNKDNPRLSTSLSEEIWNERKKDADEYIKKCMTTGLLKELESQFVFYVCREIEPKVKEAPKFMYDDENLPEVPMTC